MIGKTDTANFGEPTVVIGRVGSYCGSLRYSPNPSWVTDNAIACQTKQADDLRFWYFALQTLGLNSRSSGSGQPLLNQTVLAQIPFVPPALPERRAIAEVLGVLDDKIAANAKLGSVSERLLLTEVQQRWLGDSGAHTVSILDLFEVGRSLPSPNGASPVYLGMKNLPEDSMGIKRWEHRTARGGARFTNGDTLLARITPCLENRKTGYVDFLDAGEIGIGSTEFIVLRSRDGIPSPLSYFVAVDSQFRNFAIRHMAGTSGRQRVSASDVSSYVLPAPDTEWMKGFGVRAEEQLKLMKSLRQESRTLAELRDTLLPELMSGRLQVKDVAKTIEEVV